LARRFVRPVGEAFCFADVTLIEKHGS